MFHHQARRLPTFLSRCHSFRHEGIRYSSSLASIKSTGRFAKESYSNKTAIAAMICAASVVAVSTANHHASNNTTTLMQGRFSFWSQQAPKNNNKKLLSHPNVTIWTKERSHDLSGWRPELLDGICHSRDATCRDDSSSSRLYRH